MILSQQHDLSPPTLSSPTNMILSHQHDNFLVNSFPQQYCSDDTAHYQQPRAKVVVVVVAVVVLVIVLVVVTVVTLVLV